MTNTNNSLPPWAPYWGKARPREGGRAYHLLAYHCLDVAAVGFVYLHHASALVNGLARHLNIADKAALRHWLTFWLALHDLGKFSISFQGQRADLVAQLRGENPVHWGLPHVRHDSLGMCFWAEHAEPWVMEEGWFGEQEETLNSLHWWARAVTGHHGQPPLSEREVTHLNRHFDPNDVSAALSFVQEARRLWLTPEVAAMVQDLGSAFESASQTASWWVSGLAVLADWIGSNADIFEYQDTATLSLDDYWQLALARAERALHRSGVLPGKQQPLLPFTALFPAIAQPSPLQAWASNVSIASGPQIHLLEDVTGAGKTEAAVTLAHRLMAHGVADGFFIGLPTMATANAMYGRIAQVCDRLFDSPVSLALAHQKKNLVELFASHVIEPGPDEADPQQGDESATHRCTRWLADHNKRALLAPAGVGTIDQALLGALRSKHQSLRLLGLVGKVLIVDEVHACDDYMQRVLKGLLEFHAHAGGSAILLSATLTQQMRTGLLQAFAAGCCSGPSQSAPSPIQNAYPLATSWAAEEAQTLREAPIATRADVRRTVKVHTTADRSAVIQKLVSTLSAGQCAAWICNTVGDALQARSEMAAHVPAAHISLFHARFALGDRLDIEAAVLNTFGAHSGPQERAGRLLIATQVAEQSLDVDFDLVVSDLAPIDRLIQRAGRLRRHIRDAQGQRLTATGATDQRGEPWLWVFAPPWTANPTASWFKQALPKSAAVYPHHGQLWLTAQALQAGQFTMPDDARRLIEGVFGEDACVPEGLQHNANQAEGKAYGDISQADRNRVKLQDGYLRKGLDWDADTVAPSRLGEDTIDVLLGRWEGDVLHPWYPHANPRHAWAYSTVRVAKRLISQALPPASATRLAEWQRQRDSLPGGGQWVVLLALESENGQFVGQAQAAVQAGQAPRALKWIYDTQFGLRAEATQKETQ